MTAAAFRFSYLKRIFFFTHFLGLAMGIIFPLAASPLLGPTARSWPFILACLVTGFAMGALMFLFVLITLKGQLHRQMEILRPLIGDFGQGKKTVEGLQEMMETSVARFEGMLRDLLGAIDEFVPHYRSLSESSFYLSERARDGLSAAKKSHADVNAMSEKQQEVIAQVQNLSDRSQAEAAISRELSASLEEMAGAIDHSTSKFLETTTSVNEMASSVQEVASQADGITQSVEGTARDLESIGASLERIRNGAVSWAQATDAVKQDAESGLLVVKSSMEEMERIEQESRRAREAMQRLSHQTGEVATIIEVIKELVSDTELLAFNAAIIAAKAGEEGKGFSVVAEEIRDLADRTTASAQDIHRIVKAIGGDTREVTEAVDATGQRIAKGKQLSLSTGEALRKIVESSTQAVKSSDEIAGLTQKEEARARTLLQDAGKSMHSVKVIVRAMREQQTAINRIQEGVTEMKSAADQVACGMEEQVRATREFDRGLNQREEQIQAINEATRFQMSTVQRVFEHFEVSENRLGRNEEKAKIIAQEGAAMEILVERLRQLVVAVKQQEIAAASSADPKQPLPRKTAA
ncbi:MAG: methyl-accepting chemotaxis protein [Desulfuromonadales bacterium]